MKHVREPTAFRPAHQHQALRLRSNRPWSTYTRRREDDTVARPVSDGVCDFEREVGCAERTIVLDRILELSSPAMIPRLTELSHHCGSEALAHFISIWKEATRLTILAGRDPRYRHVGPTEREAGYANRYASAFLEHPGCCLDGRSRRWDSLGCNHLLRKLSHGHRHE